VSPLWKRAAEQNPSVSSLNVELKRVAEEEGVQFVDLVPAMSLEGFLRDELTYDGVHLTARGYALWAGLVRDALVRSTVR
jgi:lysophospholipase L1-like esterase